MSKESLEAFLQKALSGSGLKSEIEAVFTENKGEEAINELVRIGSEQGFEFTAEEAVKFLSAENGELSDSELEGVAGGGIFLDFLNHVVESLRRVGP